MGRACYPERAVSRRRISLSATGRTIWAYAALAVYALAIAAPGTFPAWTGGQGILASASQTGAPSEEGLKAVAPYAPRSDEHLTRPRDVRPGGSVHVSLPVALLPVASTSVTIDAERAFCLETEQRSVPTCFVSARSSRGPPDRRV